MRLSSTLTIYILKASSDGDATMSLGRLSQWFVVLTVKNVLYQDEASPGAAWTHCSVSSPSGNS